MIFSLHNTLNSKVNKDIQFDNGYEKCKAIYEKFWLYFKVNKTIQFENCYEKSNAI